QLVLAVVELGDRGQHPGRGPGRPPAGGLVDDGDGHPGVGGPPGDAEADDPAPDHHGVSRLVEHRVGLLPPPALSGAGSNGRRPGSRPLSPVGPGSRGSRPASSSSRYATAKERPLEADDTQRLRELRQVVYREFVEEGRPPTAAEAARRLQIGVEEVLAGWGRLAGGAACPASPSWSSTPTGWRSGWPIRSRPGRCTSWSPRPSRSGGAGAPGTPSGSWPRSTRRCWSPPPASAADGRWPCWPTRRSSRRS